MRFHKIPRGHFLVEFVMIFPLFLLMLLGLGDLFLLSLSRLSLQRACFHAAKYYAVENRFPSAMKGHATVLRQALPGRSSSNPLRSSRTFELIQVECQEDTTLRSPLFRLIYRDRNFTLKARSAALRVSYGAPRAKPGDPSINDPSSPLAAPGSSEAEQGDIRRSTLERFPGYNPGSRAESDEK